MAALRAAFAALAAALVAGCAAAPAPTPEASAPAATVSLRLLAINDFHGCLMPPPGGLRQPDPNEPGRVSTVPAGGAAVMATAVRELAAGHPNHVFVAAGDLVGASPLLSALFHDEPTVESMSAMGLAFSAVGNHEFDEGAAELLRLQHGGCHPVDGCRGPQPFAGAGFQYLAASTVVRATGKTLLPAYAIRRFDGVPVAFVGLTLKGTPHIVMPSGVAGLEFRDEADTVNALVPELRRQGVNTIVVLLHEGGEADGGRDGCDNLRGAITRIVPRLDRAVAVVVSGHTHRSYVCRVDGRLVTSGDHYGMLVTAIDLQLDRASGRVLQSDAKNVVVDPARFAPDAGQQALIERYARLAAPLADRVVGTIGGPLTRELDASGETVLGRVVADAQLEATRAAGAQIALTNLGGLRSAILPPPDGRVRYAEVFEAQPFGNHLVTMTITGAQLAALLEHEFHGDRPRVLQVSRGLRCEWHPSLLAGRRILPGTLTLDGLPITPTQRLRVTVNSYLADGGESYAVLREGSDRVVGIDDAEALAQYLGAHPGLQPPRDARLVRRP